MPGPRKSGSALLIAVIILVLLFGLAMGLISVSFTTTREVRVLADTRQALYLAETGIEEAYKLIATEKWSGPHEPVSLALEQTSVEIEDFDESSVYRRITSTGIFRGHRTRIEAVIGGLPPHPLFTKAIFAGNRTGSAVDPLDFSGSGGDRDRIYGDVYTNTDVTFSKDADVFGKISATGTIDGYEGNNAELDPGTEVIDPPDLREMDYENYPDVVLVNDEQNWSYWDSRHGYRIMDTNDPAHIFMKDLYTAEQIAQEYASHTGGAADHVPDNPNYWLQDWDENLDSWVRGGVHPISISPSGNNKVYFVDGNLWIDASRNNVRDGYGDVKFTSEGDGTRITLVVRGNIYVGDGILV
ncbi:MAG: hypothetical protein ACYS8W_09870, partial [Planctomycetota bacterium]